MTETLTRLPAAPARTVVRSSTHLVASPHAVTRRSVAPSHTAADHGWDTAVWGRMYRISRPGGRDGQACREVRRNHGTTTDAEAATESAGPVLHSASAGRSAT